MIRKYHTVANWLQTPMGRFVLQRESELVGEALEKVFGLHTVQVGAWGAGDVFLRHSKSRRRLLVAGYPSDDVDIVSRPAALGVASDSVDAVILPHTLELDAQPHEALREVHRVLVGDGHVILLGFNPYGSWGMSQRAGFIPSSEGHALSQHRLIDWLTLLGLEPVDRRPYLHLPPINREAMARRADNLEKTGGRLWPWLAGAYMITARKRVYTTLPMRPVWYRRRPVAGGLAEPTTRSAA